MSEFLGNVRHFYVFSGIKKIFVFIFSGIKRGKCYNKLKCHIVNFQIVYIKIIATSFSWFGPGEKVLPGNLPNRGQG